MSINRKAAEKMGSRDWITIRIPLAAHEELAVLHHEITSNGLVTFGSRLAAVGEALAVQTGAKTFTRGLTVALALKALRERVQKK
jgi:hypothetical protein